MPRRATAARPAATAAITAPAVHTPRVRSFVTVACKLAVARFELQLCQKKQVQENTQTGVRTVEQHFKTGEVWVVRGTAYPQGTPPKGFIKRPEEIAGYVLTRKIPKDFWDAWVAQYGKTEMVRNKLIYACDTEDELEGIAGEHAAVKCAMSPLDMPDKDTDPVDTRVPRSITDGVGNIERLNV